MYFISGAGELPSRVGHAARRALLLAQAFVPAFLPIEPLISLANIENG